MRTSSRGFTLIELLVVVAIIGILSATVVASLRTAQGRAQDSAVRAQAVQLRNILALEFNDTGSYAAIKSGGAADVDGTWYGVGQACTGFTGTYATQAANICTALVKAAGTPCGEDGCVFFRSTSPDSPTRFSILVYLPYASRQAGSTRYLCVGSSGNISISDASVWTQPGCWQNP